MVTEKIDSFRGAYSFLSNFWEHEITLPSGRVFPSSEAAYQSFKSINDSELPEYSKLGPAEVKKYAHSNPVNPIWDFIKVDVMYLVLKIKFQDEFLAKKLKETGNKVLIEGNTWHDNFWGDCHCGRKACESPGVNRLGKLLMRIRKEL